MTVIKKIVKYQRIERRHSILYDNKFFLNCSTNTTQNDKISITCYSCSFENRNVNTTHFSKRVKIKKKQCVKHAQNSILDTK